MLLATGRPHERPQTGSPGALAKFSVVKVSKDDRLLAYLLINDFRIPLSYPDVLEAVEVKAPNTSSSTGSRAIPAMLTIQRMGAGEGLVITLCTVRIVEFSRRRDPAGTARHGWPNHQQHSPLQDERAGSHEPSGLRGHRFHTNSGDKIYVRWTDGSVRSGPG
jgi:hypothetical protein